MENICRNCLHWGGKHLSLSEMIRQDPYREPNYWATHHEEAKTFLVEQRTTTNKWGCKPILDILEIDLDQGSGWDAGGASVEEVHTPGDFGCNKFEAWA